MPTLSRYRHGVKRHFGECSILGPPVARSNPESARTKCRNYSKTLRPSISCLMMQRVLLRV